MIKSFTVAALGGTSLFASAAIAQTVVQPAPAGATVSNGTEVTPTSTATAADQPGNGDIVVTATRRAERLQDVPLAVSAISGAQLSKGGFKNLTDIQFQLSGVQFGTSPNDAGFRLRGVGTAGGFSSASEQNVGTIVDNVVVPFGNPVQSLGDLDRVEVLKGPQGTQFGKNSSSGVVNITTRKPDLNKAGGSFFASYAELREHDVHGSVNVPLVAGKAALSVYAFHRGHAGFLENITLHEKWGGEKTYGVRAKLLIQPTDNFSAYLIGDYSSQTARGPGQLWSINRLPSFANPLMAARFGPDLAAGIVPGFYNDKTSEEYEGFNGERNYGASLELNLGLGNYNLTSISAYRKLDVRPNHYAIDVTSTPVFKAQETGNDRDFVSQEIRLTSPKGSAFEYVTGVYISRLRAGLNSYASAQLEPAAPFFPFIVSITNGLNHTRTDTNSAAVFIDGTFRFTDQFRALGGIRYSHDKVSASTSSTIDPAFPPGPPFPVPGQVIAYAPNPLQTGKVSKGGVSGRFGLEYKPTRDLLFFATVARGYLGPTVTFSGLTGTRSQVNPQTVRDLTIGAKTQFLDRRLTINADIFFDRYKDLQTSVFNGLEFLTENAGGFDAKGFEVDTSLRISRQLMLNGSFTYSKTKFTDYVTACPNSILAAGAAAVAAQCNATGSTASTPLYQAAGNPLPGAPRYSATFGFDFKQPVSNDLQFDVAANYYYRSKVQYDVGNSLSVQRGYSTVGGTIGFGQKNGAWRVAVFARNLFDKRFVSNVIGLPFADPGGEVNWLAREGRRTIGASIEARF